MPDSYIAELVRRRRREQDRETGGTSTAVAEPRQDTAYGSEFTGGSELGGAAGLQVSDDESFTTADYFGEIVRRVRQEAKDAANIVLQKAGEATGAAFSGVGEAIGKAGEVVGVEAGGKLRQFGADVKAGAPEAFPTSPGYAESVRGQVLGAAGTTIPAIPAFVAGGPVGLGAFAAATNYDTTLQELRQRKVPEKEAQLFALASGVVGGATEGIGVIPGVAKMLGRLDDLTGGFVARQLARMAGGEAVQEVTQEVPVEVARQVYDKDRSFIDSLVHLGKTGALGGSVGLLLGGFGLSIRQAALGDRAPEFRKTFPQPAGTPEGQPLVLDPSIAIGPLNPKLAALANLGRPPSRKEYAEAVGIKESRSPKAELRQAEAEAALDAIQAKEVADAAQVGQEQVSDTAERGGIDSVGQAAEAGGRDQLGQGGQVPPQEGEAVAAGRAQLAAAVDLGRIPEVGHKVRPADRNNIGTVTSIDESTQTATVSFFNKKTGLRDSKTFPWTRLRDIRGQPYLTEVQSALRAVPAEELRPLTAEPPPETGRGDRPGQGREVSEAQGEVQGAVVLEKQKAEFLEAQRQAGISPEQAEKNWSAPDNWARIRLKYPDPTERAAAFERLNAQRLSRDIEGSWPQQERDAFVQQVQELYRQGKDAGAIYGELAPQSPLSGQDTRSLIRWAISNEPGRVAELDVLAREGAQRTEQEKVGRIEKRLARMATMKEGEFLDAFLGFVTRYPQDIAKTVEGLPPERRAVLLNRKKIQFLPAWESEVRRAVNRLTVTPSQGEVVQEQPPLAAEGVSDAQGQAGGLQRVREGEQRGQEVVQEAQGAEGGAQAEEVVPPGEPPSPPTEVDLILPETTSLKQAVTTEERAARGLPPIDKIAKLTDPEAARYAEEAFARNSNVGYELVGEIHKDPRSLSTQEEAVLVRHRAGIIKQHTETLKVLMEAQDRGDTDSIAELQGEEDRLAKARQEVEVASDVTGGLAGQSFRFRRNLINIDDFSLATMVMQERAGLGRRLTPDELSALQKEQAEGERLRAKLTEVIKKQGETETELAAAQALNEILKDATPPPKTSKRYIAARKEVEDAWKEFAAETSGKLFSIGGQLEAFPSLLKLARAYLNLGVVNVQEFVARATKRMDKEKAGKFKSGLEQAWAVTIEQERPQPTGDLETKHELSLYAGRLTRFFVGTGVRTVKGLIDSVHGELRKALPGITRRETMEAIPHYGQSHTLSKDEVDVVRRSLVGQLLQIDKLVSMKAGEPPLATGLRRTFSDEERKLIRIVNEKKREGGFVITDPETQLKSANQARQTWLTHRIADLKAAIAKGERLRKKTGSLKLEAKTQELQNEYEAATKEYNDAFGRPELTDQQRSDIAADAAEKSAIEYERKVREGDLSAKKKGRPATVTPRLEANRARRDAAKAELQHLRDLNNPKKTPDERANSALRANVARRIADWQDRMAREDYAPKPKRDIKLEPETEKARLAEEQWRKTYHARRDEYRRRNRTLVAKVSDITGDVLFNVSKFWIFGWDAGVFLLQGGAFTFGHPIKSTGALAKAIKDVGNAATASRHAHELTLRQNSRNGLYRDARLQFSSSGGPLGAQEETVMSSLADRLPILKQIARGTSAYLNLVRADSMDILAATVTQREGEITREQARILGGFVNIATGRGNWGKLAPWLVVANKAFLAPKWVLSRYQAVLAPPVWFVRGDSAVRVALAKEIGRSFAGFAAVNGLAAAGLWAAYGPPGDDKEWDINYNPGSPKKMGIRIHNRTIDLSIGIGSAMRFLTHMGIVVLTPEQAKKWELKNPGFELVNYLRGKLGPAFSAAVSRIAGTTQASRKNRPVKATWWQLAKDMVTPVNANDIYDSMIEYGMPAEKALGILSVFGVPVKTERSTSRLAD